MSQALAVKYRPSRFEDVCGQGITVKILEKAIEQKNFKHAYLFAGDSGCGKTTLARIFANAINQGLGQPIEIDAASNNGVDQVRLITDSASERSLDSEYKIFIIDECHSITSAGWQAFLKSIEETPEYTIYMFCTTDPNKVPTTILNRVQRYNITKIDTDTIKNRLLYICKQEGFVNYEQACDFIAKTSNGCLRDAIMKLDQCANFSTDLNMDNVKQIINDISYEAMFKLTVGLQDKNEAQALEIIEKLYSNGVDLKNFIDRYLEFILDLTKYILFKNMQLTSIPAYLEPAVQSTIHIDDSLNWFKKFADLLLRIKLDIKYDTSYKSSIEAYLLRTCR
ncbi:MAG: DNA polymerase III subunit gamma/tau [Bacilli bacterium]|nr:DNA polymerase III subunit gamma/tau [Bacilli bacterium]